MLAKLPAILSAKTNGPDFAAWAVLLFDPKLASGYEPDLRPVRTGCVRAPRCDASRQRRHGVRGMARSRTVTGKSESPAGVTCWRHADHHTGSCVLRSRAVTDKEHGDAVSVCRTSRI